MGMTLALMPLGLDAAQTELEIGNGLVAIEESRFDDAFKYFTNFLNDNAGNQVGLYYRSVAALGKGDKATALNDINKAMTAKGGLLKKKEIGKDELLVQRGKVYLETGQLKQAEADFDQALATNGSNAQALVSKGKVLAQNHETELSDEFYKKALALQETNLEANLGLVENMVSRDDYNGATNLLTKLNTLYPKNNAIYTLRGDAYQMMGRYKEAFDDAVVQTGFQEDYSKFMPQLTARALQCYTYALPKIGGKINSGESIDLWLQVRARIYEQLDRYDEAIADYHKLQEALGEEFALICANAGNCQRKKGSTSEAEQSFKRSVELEENAEAYAYWGATKLNEGKLDSALLLANKAVNAAPTNASWYYLRGRIREALGNKDQALRDYETGLQVDHKNSNLLLAHATLLQDKKKDPKADLNNICEFEKLPQPAFNKKALALLWLGRQTEALEWQNKVLAKFPTAANYKDAALLYAEMGSLPKCIDMLDRAFSQGYAEFGTLKHERALKDVSATNEFAELMKKWNAQEPKAKKKAPIEADTAKADLPVIPCTVNGMMLTFTTNTDTARIFTISVMDVQMLLKYGYMQKQDVVSQRDQEKLDIMALEPGTEVVLRTFKWGNKVLKNVTATLVEDPLAPILLTQGKLNEIDK